jgi:hypothetical protein
MNKPKWKRFEKLVAKIQADLAPKALVKHNEKMRGKSGIERQVDVTIRQDVGQFQVLIVIDAKDHKAPVDINELGSFIDLVSDVGAQMGAMVSPNGFTEGAKLRARATGIDLYRLVDAESEDWRTYVSLGALAHCSKLKAVAFSLQGPPWLANLELETISIFDYNGNRLGSPIDMIHRRWNENLLPLDPGVHHNLGLADGPVFVKREGRFYPVMIRAEAEVEEELYFGKLPLTKIQGFQDVQTGGILSKGYTTDLFSYDSIRAEWQRLESVESLAVTTRSEVRPAPAGGNRARRRLGAAPPVPGPGRRSSPRPPP